VVLQLVRPEPDVVLDGNFAHVDAAADLGRMITFCAKNDLGGNGRAYRRSRHCRSALRMNAEHYGMQIGSYVREVKLYRAATKDRSSPATKFLSNTGTLLLPRMI